jgi:hypothetical protein
VNGANGALSALACNLLEMLSQPDEIASVDVREEGGGSESACTPLCLPSPHSTPAHHTLWYHIRVRTHAVLCPRDALIDTNTQSPPGDTHFLNTAMWTMRHYYAVSMLAGALAVWHAFATREQ